MADDGGDTEEASSALLLLLRGRARKKPLPRQGLFAESDSIRREPIDFRLSLRDAALFGRAAVTRTARLLALANKTPRSAMISPKQMVNAATILFLLVNTFASQVDGATYSDIPVNEEPQGRAFLQTLTSRSSRPASRPRQPRVESLTALEGPLAKLPKMVRFPEGYPTAAISPLSVSRQRLMQLLHNPAFKRPNMDDLPIQVMIKLIPIKIQDLIEKNEVLETTLRLQLTWQDKRLSWNEALFHNLSEIVIPGNLIWVPDIAILNSVSDLYHVVRDTRFEMKIQSTGRIWWHPTGIVKTNCKLYLRYFPFDKQLCKFVFESPTFDLRFMNLTLRSEKSPVDTRMYTDGETWQLLGFNGKNIINQVGSRTFFARVEFLIRIERAKIYHLLNVILPAIFLSTVQVMFFLLPATHPQRVGSSTTTLLSVVVFQTVAVAQLPKTSTDIPLLSIYIFFVIIVSALSVGTSIIVAKFVVYAEKNVEVPHWIARIPHPVSCWQAMVCCLCCCCRAVRFKMERQMLEHPQQDAELPLNDQRSLSAHSFRRNFATSKDGYNGYGSNAEIDPHGEVQVKITETPSVVLHRLNNKPFDGVLLNPGYERPYDRHRPEERHFSILSTGHFEQRYLFRTWADISRFVDLSLLTVAASIAVLSPVALFVIMPVIAADKHLVDYQHKA